MNFTNSQVCGWEGAIHGMRNPLESWAKSDSGWVEDTSANEYKNNYKCLDVDCDNCLIKVIGENDLGLMQRLIKGGSEHRKFLRYIHVQVDITAPIYWWKEFDTYKVGTVANSTSTMHKIQSKPITLDCFEIDDFCRDLKVFDNEPYNYDEYMQDCSETIIDICETLRKRYLETKDKRYWKELIRWLPESWLQTRTVDLNYEVLRTIVHQREGHKLTEWHSFIAWVKSLPYAEELIFFANNNEDMVTANKFNSMMNEIKKLGENPFQADLMKIIKKYTN